MGLMSNFLYDFSTNAFANRKHLQLIPTGRVTKNIFAVRTGSVNLFIYKKGSDQIAIDSGYGKSILRRELSSLNINPDTITSLFLTHTDFDHARGLSVFQNAQIYLSSHEEPMITRKVSRKYGIIYNRKINKPYKLLKDNDEVAIGTIKVRAIETPGHTPGSMTYLIDDKFLFVGDAFRLIDGKAHPNSSFYCMDTEEQEKSIKRLAKLKNVQLVFTAHGGQSNDYDYVMANWIHMK
ncbi:MBL fold metallo-hydrolase [Caproiciproducens sp. R1]|uniref:MBL fold metallo-hydrolase n=1 Tax=Caproiciproducens sp. R1 TaxID=3435000 RepID=UPI004034F60C